jgi:predicted DNA-binding transcriptional regulator AlpA
VSININGEKYLSLKEVLKVINISQASLYEKLRYNCFPKPFKPESRSFWKESEIEEYKEKNRKNANEVE